MVKKINKIPEGIKILAFLLFVGALVSLAVGGIMFSFADVINKMDPNMIANAGITQGDSWIIILIGIILIGVAIFEYFLGKGLLKAQNWTRIAIGTFTALGIVSAIMNFSNAMYASASFGIVVNSVVIWYLFINEESKNFFK